MTLAPAGPVVAAPSTVSALASRPKFAIPLPPRVPPGPAAPGPHPALAALAVIDRAQARLDAVLAAARAGRSFTAAELIGLQAQAYRCAQSVDLASKLAEQGAGSVKQALNTQL